MPEKNGPWDQHLDELNSKQYSRKFKVSLVRIEGPFENRQTHTMHVHPYWQMSIVLRKSFSVSIDQLIFTPKCGEILLIPPQNWHLFDLLNGKNSWTVKFMLKGLMDKLPAGIVRLDKKTAPLISWLSSLMSHETEMSRAQLILLEYLIAAVIDIHYINLNIGGKETEILRMTRNAIYEALQKGDSVKADDVARAVGVSTAYITRVAKQQLGMPLKTLIDQQRFDAMRGPLASGCQNMSELAQNFGFADVFAFSRFVKRVSGLFPSDYRKLFA